MTATMPNGFAEFALMMVTYVGVSFALTGDYKCIFPPILAYCSNEEQNKKSSLTFPKTNKIAFAWFGHFVFEHNRPATFIYPSYSLMGDYRMWFEVLTGQIGLGK